MTHLRQNIIGAFSICLLCFANCLSWSDRQLLGHQQLPCRTLANPCCTGCSRYHRNNRSILMIDKQVPRHVDTLILAKSSCYGNRLETSRVLDKLTICWFYRPWSVCNPFEPLLFFSRHFDAQ